MAKRLVGRASELEQLEGLLESATVGGAELALITGEPGIGKSTLVGEFARRAMREGAVVSWGRASELSGAPPHWPLIQILDDIAGAEAAADEGSAEAGAVASIRAARRALEAVEEASAPTPHARFQQQHRIARALRGAGDVRRCVRVLVLEDLHAADLDTLRVLSVLAETLQEGDRLLVIGTARPVDVRWTEVSRELFDGLSRRAECLRLGGLSEGAIAQLVAPFTDSRSASETAKALLVQTGGNPLFVHGLIRMGARGKLPRTVRAAIEAQLATLSPETTALLRIACVIDTRFEVALVAAAAGRTVADCTAQLEEAVAAEVLRREAGGFRFAHALFGEQLEASLDPEQRAGCHLAVAETLMSRPGPDVLAHLTRTALHFAEVARVRPEPRGLTWIQNAAERSRRARAYDAAADLYVRALELALDQGVDPATRVDLRITLGETALLAGRRELARESLLDALLEAESLSGGGLARGAVALVRVAEFGVSDPEVRRWVERAIDAKVGTQRTRAFLHAGLARLLWAENRPREERLAVAANGVALARSAGDVDAEVEALSALSAAIWSPHTTRERLSVADELGGLAGSVRDPGLRFEAHRWRLNVAWELGDAARAERAYMDYVDGASALGSPQALMNAALRRSTRAQIRGALDEALEANAELLVMGERSGDPQYRLYEACGRLYPLIASGERGALEALLPELERACARWKRFAAAGFLTSMVHLALERVEDMRRCLDEPLDADSCDCWGYPHRLGMMAELAIALDDRERARDILERLLPFSGQYQWSGIGMPMGPVTLSLGRLARYLGEVESAEAYFARARSEALAAGDGRRAEEATRQLAPRSDAAGSLGSITRDDGDFVFDYRGTRTRFRAVRGLTYLATLIARSPHEIHVLELAGEGTAPAVALDGDLGPDLDPEAKRQYRERVEELRGALAEAEAWNDAHRAARLREELEFLLAELGRAVGIGGRDRVRGAASEKARVSVTKAIKRAIERVAAKDASLGRHLENSVRTGAYCSYAPEPGIRLRVE